MKTSCKQIILLSLGVTAMLFLSTNSTAQWQFRDSSIALNSIEFGYTSSLGAGDLTDRTNWIHGIKISLNRKTSTNFLLSLNTEIELADFNENFDPLKNLKSDSGFPIDLNGQLTEININYFGYQVYGELGKFWNTSKPYKGFITSLQAGFWQHKLTYQFTGDVLPYLNTESRKGYDRLANGLLIGQKVGYRRYSPQNLFSYEFGLHLQEGFTAIRRSYIYDIMQVPPSSRFDMKLGLYATFIFPIYK
ncbi:MAG: hypothetical protein KDC92_13710 [Bacteroidetes bacterium]|nr:hypothetical protein [Bacteroidota bacterium]